MPITRVLTPEVTPKADLEVLQKACSEISETIHDELEVQDPEDKEIRVQKSQEMSDKTIREMIIEFTEGRWEYSNFPRKSFFPSRDRIAQIEATGSEIQKKYKESPYNIARTTIRAWRNTTFLMCEADRTEPMPVVTKEQLLSAGRNVRESNLVIVLSPT
jgi:hypothetical protein